MKSVLAIDPGMSGAWALLRPGHDCVWTDDLPTLADEIDVLALARVIRAQGPQEVIVERVGPMPTDSRPSAFRFGRAYACATTVVAMLEIPLRLVTPQTWKRHFRLAGGKEGKEAARKLAIQRFPVSADRFARKRDDGRAEAALLALYFREVLEGRS